MTPHVPPSAEELEEWRISIGTIHFSGNPPVDEYDIVRLIHEVERLRGVCDGAAEQLPRLVAGSANWDALVKRLRAAAEGK